MIKLVSIFLFSLSAILLQTPAFALNDYGDTNCHFNERKVYGEIKYWARKYVGVSDYNNNTGDSEALGLTFKIPGKYISQSETSKEIVTHFNNEFERLIQGGLPFHDATAGESERRSEFRKKNKNPDDFAQYEKFLALESARRSSLYGDNPGALWCLIDIERREFPVLYEVSCNITAPKQLIANRGGLKQEMIGYSSDEYILGEVKRAITKTLEHLGRDLKALRSCE